MIVGIDPGFKGGIVFLDPTGVEVHDMPVMKDSAGRNQINHYSLGQILTPKKEGRRIAVLERVSAMAGWKPGPVFRFGQGYGALEMALIGHGYELHYVTPTVWKRHFRLARDNDVSRAMAIQRFPTAAEYFSRKMDDGRADAALIALYGVETITGAAEFMPQ